jgi:hypothetical protein
MQFKSAPNGKLDLMVSYNPEFERADLYPQELRSMKDSAEFYLGSSNKVERRLGTKLRRAVAWIEREVWYLQEEEKMKIKMPFMDLETEEETWSTTRTGYLPNREPEPCGVPNCPENHRHPRRPDPNCNCGKPMGIYIPPGEHVHPCPVHPERVMRGPEITW